VDPIRSGGRSDAKGASALAQTNSWYSSFDVLAANRAVTERQCFYKIVMARPSGQNLFLLSVLAASGAIVAYLLLVGPRDGVARDSAPTTSDFRLENIPFNGARAYEHLKELCDLGPRFSGSSGMRAQQSLLEKFFRGLGASTRWQTFAVRSPLDGARVEMANLIITWHPDRKERILLAAHYDTRPFPDRDPQDPNGLFIGANDGASGVALLMELGRRMSQLSGALGVDFVLFDGEELVFKEDDRYFLGSEYFANDYAAHPPGHKYRWAVVLDMIGDANLTIPRERYSVDWVDSRPLVKSLWDTAARLKVREFVNQNGNWVRDDHLKLHQNAGIAACDVIDINYPYWHTTGDTPDKCSALSLAKVGWVVEEWLKRSVKP
jgi:glutaminyl-peptide cyclotransferase